MVAKGVIVGLALLALVDRCLASLQCEPCTEFEEVDPPPKCSYGLTIFPCGCYHECAKGPGEDCGGPFGQAGRCAEGLNCEVEKRKLFCKDKDCIIGILSGSDIGTCVEREVIEWSTREGPEADGSYSFQFISSDDIRREEMGYPQGDDGAIVQEGSYLYPLPNGSIATFKYIADANGFRVESPLLPTPPPMPPYALAQIEKVKREREN